MNRISSNTRDAASYDSNAAEVTVSKHVSGLVPGVVGSAGDSLPVNQSFISSEKVSDECGSGIEPLGVIGMDEPCIEGNGNLTLPTTKNAPSSQNISPKDPSLNYSRLKSGFNNPGVANECSDTKIATLSEYNPSNGLTRSYSTEAVYASSKSDSGEDQENRNPDNASNDQVAAPKHSALGDPTESSRGVSNDCPSANGMYLDVTLKLGSASCTPVMSALTLPETTPMGEKTMKPQKPYNEDSLIHGQLKSTVNLSDIGTPEDISHVYQIPSGSTTVMSNPTDKGEQRRVTEPIEDQDMDGGNFSANRMVSTTTYNELLTISAAAASLTPSHLSRSSASSTSTGLNFAAVDLGAGGLATSLNRSSTRHQVDMGSYFSCRLHRPNPPSNIESSHIAMPAHQYLIHPSISYQKSESSSPSFSTPGPGLSGISLHNLYGSTQRTREISVSVKSTALGHVVESAESMYNYSNKNILCSCSFSSTVLTEGFNICDDRFSEVRGSENCCLKNTGNYDGDRILHSSEESLVQPVSMSHVLEQQCGFTSSQPLIKTSTYDMPITSAEGNDPMLNRKDGGPSYFSRTTHTAADVGIALNMIPVVSEKGGTRAAMEHISESGQDSTTREVDTEKNISPSRHSFSPPHDTNKTNFP